MDNVKKCDLLLYALFWRTRLRLRRQLDLLPVTLHYTPLITCFNKKAKKKSQTNIADMEADAYARNLLKLP